MKAARLFWMCFVACLSGGHCTAADEQPKKTVENAGVGPVSLWSSISYPAMTPWRKWITLPLMVPTIRVENKGDAGMEVSLNYFLPSEVEQKKTGKVAAETVTASLYRNEEKPVPLKETFSSHIYYGSGPEPEYRELYTTHAFSIPWGPNAFDDAWVRLDLKDRTFWVELPYGFTRKPDDPPAPADTKRAAPKTAPFEKGDPKPEDRVIPWEYVSYSLGEVKGGVLATVNMANPFNAMTELKLERCGGDVREPECSVKQILLPGYEETGQCTSLILDRREPRTKWQMFRYGTAPDDSRRLCQVEVTIAGEKRTLTVPSSLTYYCHGNSGLRSAGPYLKIPEKWR